MFNCTICEARFFGSVMLEIHLSTHGLSKAVVDKYVYKQVMLNANGGNSLAYKRHRNKYKKFNLSSKKGKVKFSWVKDQIIEYLKMKGYTDEDLINISKTESPRTLSLELQQGEMKIHAAKIHKTYRLKTAKSRQKKKKKPKLSRKEEAKKRLEMKLKRHNTGQKKNQGLFDRTESSIWAISTPMGDKR